MFTQKRLKCLTEYTIDDGDGYSFSCVDYGATLTALKMPDKDGKIANVLLQFNNLHAIYSDQTYFFGKAIGRVGGRIKGGSIHLNGQNYQLPQNEGDNTLHGGSSGFHHALWNSKQIKDGIEFSRKIRSEDDEFPGNLTVLITYKWLKKHQLVIQFKGINDSDEDTLFNPTVHSYFNLNNDPKTNLANHDLSIHSNQITEFGEDLVPTGRFLPTKGTLFDFLHAQSLPERIEQLSTKHINGYDHPFKVSGPMIATLRNTRNGRQIDYYSDRNALIVYTLNAPTTSEKVNNGSDLQPHMAVALEPQTLPDAIHHKGFGSIVLPKHKSQSYQIIYELSVNA